MAEVWTPPPFDDIAFAELVTAAYLNGLGNSLRFLKEVDYEENTSNVSVTATTEGTANAVVSLSTLTYEAVPHLFEFFCPQARPDNGAVGRGLHITLFDSTTALGELAFLQTPAASSMNMPVYAVRRFTPPASSKTYNVKAWVSAGTGLLAGNAGGAATNFPIFLRATRVPT